MKKILILTVVLLSMTFALEARAEDAWATRCDAVAEGVSKPHCEAFQRLMMKESGQRLVEFAIGFPEDQKTARGIVVLPLGILLQPGVRMQIDENKPFSFKVRYCDASGCYAYLSMNDAILDMMKKGSKATLKFQSTAAEEVAIPLSLAGFTKALKEVTPPQ